MDKNGKAYQAMVLSILLSLVTIPTPAIARGGQFSQPPDILSLRPYYSLGCFYDTGNRAIPSIEGTSQTLDGHYRKRESAVQKCFQVALSLGYSSFALQDGGQCFSSSSARKTYNKYGASEACADDGKGGPLSNEVYAIKVCQTANYTCNNGGTCEDGTGVPICNCPASHWGDHCEKPKECSCSDFINQFGFGKCNKRFLPLGNQISCYVNEPSSCSDLFVSQIQPGKHVSAKACLVKLGPATSKDNQISATTVKHLASTQPERTCNDVSLAARMDCHPMPNATQKSCTTRGCCWEVNYSTSHYPFCFYPQNENTREQNPVTETSDSTNKPEALAIQRANCPRMIEITSTMSPNFQPNSGDWMNKLGRYIFIRYDGNNAIYEHNTKKGNFLYKNSNAWMVGDEVGKDFGWIGNPNCDEECPSNCRGNSWMHWHGVTGGRGSWKSDNSLQISGVITPTIKPMPNKGSSETGCVMWRQTGACQPDGTREPEHDKNCDEHIEYESGFCECRNGQKAMKKGCDLPYFYDVNYDTCEEACADLGKAQNPQVVDNLINDVDYPAEDPRPYITAPEHDCKDVYGSCEAHISHCNDKDPEIQTYLKENCKKTCGHCKSAIKDSRRRYTSNGHRLWTCSIVARREYPTYSQAKVACLNDYQCSFILDEGCNDSGPFKLCTAMSFTEQSANDCLYHKQG